MNPENVILPTASNNKRRGLTSDDRAGLYFSFVAASTPGPAKDVTDFNNVLVMVQGAYATGLNLVFEGSMDGTNWAPIQGVRTDTASVSSSPTLTANNVYAYDIYVGPFNYFRVRSTTWASPSGQCDVWVAGSECGVDPSIAVTAAGIFNVAGGYPHSSSSFSNPVPCGGQTKSTVDTTMLDGDLCALTLSTARQLIVKQFAGAELDWQFNSQGITTTTTAAPAKGAGATSVRNYVTAIQAVNTGASDVRLLIQDGASVIWGKTIKAGAAISETFPTPLRGSAATALNYNFSVAGAAVDLNIQGYQNF